MINVASSSPLHGIVADTNFGLIFDWITPQAPGENIKMEEKLLSPFGSVAQMILHVLFAFYRGIAQSVAFIFFTFGLYLYDLLEVLRISIGTGKNSPTAVCIYCIAKSLLLIILREHLFTF